MSSEPIHPLITMIRRLNRRLVDWIDVPLDDEAQPIADVVSEAQTTLTDTPTTRAVRVETTPNPNAMKYLLPTTQAPRTLTQAGDAAGDPFAPLLKLEGVRSVFVMESFLTVLKAPGTTWEELSPRVLEQLEDASE